MANNENYVSVEIDGPFVRSVTESSAVIKWKGITNVPDGLSDHYQYDFEYKEEYGDWAEWETRYSHDPSTGQYQDGTLTGLTYYTTYRVRVKAYIILGTDGDWNDYRVTYYTQFMTACTGKSGQSLQC